MAGENTTIPPDKAVVAAENGQIPSLDPATPATDEIPGEAPSVSKNKFKQESMHDIPHSHFRWHANALADGHEVCQGVVKDISMKGFNFFSDHNLQNAKRVKLQIHIPPIVVNAPHHVLEVTGKISSTVYDSVEDSFRSGISFLEFALESDRAYLLSKISGQ